LGKKLVDAQEVANMVNFVLSGAARSLNGSVLVVDGGITIKL
jgi:enoyl-[acyl-carrier-protein] reductase (NADH)